MGRHRWKFDKSLIRIEWLKIGAFYVFTCTSAIPPLIRAQVGKNGSTDYGRYLTFS